MILQLHELNYICTYMEVSITFFIDRLYFFLIEHEEIYPPRDAFKKKKLHMEGHCPN